MVDVCRLRRLFRTQNREPGHRIGILVLFHESEVRLGYRYGRYGLAIGLFWVSSQVVQSEETIHGIKMFLSFLPAIGTILSVLFISMYPLSEKKMKVITTELEKKRKE